MEGCIRKDAGKDVSHAQHAAITANADALYQGFHISGPLRGRQQSDP